MAETRNIIVHGDSRQHLHKVKGKVNLWLTDPPYGMDFSSNQATTEHGKKMTEKIEGDDNVVEAIETFHSIAGALLPRMADDADMYIFTAWHVYEHWVQAVRDLAFVVPDEDGKGGAPNNSWVWDGPRNMYVPFYPDVPPTWNIEVKMMIVWEKGDPGMGDLEGNWGCGHEVAIYAKLGRRPIHHRRTAVLHYDKVPTGKNIHPTQKPEGLLQELIKMSTNPGDLVVDTYSGSGSTSYAAKLCGRNSLAFEIDERWIEKSRARLEAPLLFG